MGLWWPLLWWPRIIMMGAFTFLLYDAMAYKFHHDDVRRIERATGKPAKDLTEEELVAAMQRLGISRLELTPDEQRTVAGEQGTVHCVYCGAQLASRARYCAHCGEQV